MPSTAVFYGGVGPFDLCPDVTTYTAPTVLIRVHPNGAVIGAGGSFSALGINGTFTLAGAPFVTGFGNVFNFGGTIQNSYGDTRSPGLFGVYAVNPVFNANGAPLTGSTTYGYFSNPNWIRTGSPTGSTGSFTALQVNSARLFSVAVGPGWTLSSYIAVQMKAVSKDAAATVTEIVGLDCEDQSAATATPISVRSAGANQMRHAGGARFGSSTAGPLGGSILHVDGGLSVKRTVTTDADYTALTTDLVIEFPAITANRVVNLPAVATADVGKVYIVKKTTGTFTVTIDPSGAETIDGAATAALSTSNYQVIRFYSTGAAWLTF